MCVSVGVGVCAYVYVNVCWCVWVYMLSDLQQEQVPAWMRAFAKEVAPNVQVCESETERERESLVYWWHHVCVCVCVCVCVVCACLYIPHPRRWLTGCTHPPPTCRRAGTSPWRRRWLLTSPGCSAPRPRAAWIPTRYRIR